jgi:hypothetical protein
VKILTGNLWSETLLADVILVSTNAYVNKAGELVMGRGAAKEARDRFPGLAADLGALLKERNLVCLRYGILCSRMRPMINGKELRLGAFQVKYRWSDDADLDLIEYSTVQLAGAANQVPEKRIAMNFPGIGNGRLDEEQVLPILASLPDNVYIYKR